MISMTYMVLLIAFTFWYCLAAFAFFKMLKGNVMHAPELPLIACFIWPIFVIPCALMDVKE